MKHPSLGLIMRDLHCAGLYQLRELACPGRCELAGDASHPGDGLQRPLRERTAQDATARNGKGGAAIPLSDPVFLTIADDATIRRIAANGVPGTPMPAFAQSAGGMLTDKQIDAIVSGIRSRWAKPDMLRDASPPPYQRRLPAIRSTAPRHTQHTARPVMAQTVEGARRPARLSMARTLPW